MTRTCHYCGQPLPEYRMGIRFTPTQGRVYDLIRDSGQRGISLDDLTWITGIDRRGLVTHVCKINESLRTRGYRVVGHGYYQLVNTEYVAV